MSDSKLHEFQSIAIIGYDHKFVKPWDPDSVKDGIMGSEEAVIYAGEELVKLGYNVTVFMKPPKDSKWLSCDSNPQYLNINELNNDDYGFDIAIYWRRTDFTTYKVAKHNFFWPHDCWTPQDFKVDGLDGVFFLSKYYRNEYHREAPELKKIPYVISGNGILTKHFEAKNVKRVPYRCIYTSNYTRGLEILLDNWNVIKEKVPEATLDVYYGREVWLDNKEQFLDTIDKKFK